MATKTAKPGRTAAALLAWTHVGVAAVVALKGTPALKIPVATATLTATLSTIEDAAVKAGHNAASLERATSLILREKALTKGAATGQEQVFPTLFFKPDRSELVQMVALHEAHVLMVLVTPH